MKLYKDAELAQEITDLDLGIVAAGETKNFIFYVQNDLSAELKEIKFTVEHKEVEVIQSPTELKKHESAKLEIKWSPSITIKEGLKAKLITSGIELWS